MKSRVIYTSIIGGTDSLMQPAAVDPSCDYICFVRKGEAGTGRDGVWELRELPVTIEDNRMLARYAKVHPHTLLKDYEWSVWMDGNLSVAGDGFYRAVQECISAGGVFHTVKHPLRDCTYEEAYACVGADKESFSNALKVINFLASECLPRHCGLYESSIILRAHNAPGVISLDELWWSCLRTLSGRDQLSLVWCARKSEVGIGLLLPEGMNMRNSDFITYVDHQPAPRCSAGLQDFRKRIAQFLLRRRIDAVDRKFQRQCPR